MDLVPLCYCGGVVSATSDNEIGAFYSRTYKIRGLPAVIISPFHSSSCFPWKEQLPA